MYCPNCSNKLIFVENYTYIFHGISGKLFANGFIYRCMCEECIRNDWQGYFHTDEWFNLYMGRPFEYDYIFPNVGLPNFKG